MIPKELILSQLKYEETPYIPYTLDYEEDVGKKI